MLGKYAKCVVVLLLVIAIAAAIVISKEAGTPPMEAPSAMQSGEISGNEYLDSCKRSFGSANPERMRIPVWEWMVRTRQTPYAARQLLGLESNLGRPGNPDWCFERFGAAQVKMPDGRLITIGGEHEDFYDPDFCIYNDVVVQTEDRVEIYGYPKTLFPPTDFHTATRVDGAIYIIGCLGYQDERGDQTTPVFRLNTSNYSIEPIRTTGDSPGWIHSHDSEYIPEHGVIRITNGQRLVRYEDEERFLDSFDVYDLRVDSGAWHRITDNSSWRQFSLKYDATQQAWTDIDWYTGEVLQRLGYPCELAESEDDDEDPNVTPGPRSHIILVNEVRVLCSDRLEEIRLTIQGELDQSAIDGLLEQLVELARSTHRNVTEIVEL